MSSAARRLAGLAAGVAAIAVAVVAAPASGEIDLTFHNWAVYGSLTPKKLNEPVVLPKGSTFNGIARLTNLGEIELAGTVNGKLLVPPFDASLRLVGLVPTTVGVTLTEVGEAEGTITGAPPAECAHARLAGTCATLAVGAKANIGLTVVGVLGIEVPTHCETSEPVFIPLRASLPTSELDESHFKGTVTIPSINCEGLEGLALGTLLTTLMSGPDNPYALSLGATEPSAPAVATLPPLSVSQISARLHATAAPSGEPLTDCHFEFGPSAEYGTSIPCPQLPPQKFPSEANGRTALVAGLGENTTYHYRIVATNSLGTSDGADETFTTLSRAGAPEYGQCVVQKGGEYRDGGCTIKSKRAKKGKFEWKPGPAPTCFARAKGEYINATCTMKSARPHRGSFEKQAGPHFTSTGGPLTLQTPELGASKLVCAASSGGGEITAATEALRRITFTGCEMSGMSCTSEGANSTPSGTAGAIVTNLLHGRLLGPVEGQVWTGLSSAEHQPYLAEFSCGGALWRIKGSLAGVQGADVGVMSSRGETGFALHAGEQALLSERSENGGLSWAGPDASVALTTLTENTELATEIRP
jgi:hypothetical protein